MIMILNKATAFHARQYKLSHYGCRNGAKFNILNFCSYSTFIHSYSTFVSIQHHYLFKIAPIFIFNSSICSQNYYPFRNYLSIQQLFIH